MSDVYDETNARKVTIKARKPARTHTSLYFGIVANYFIRGPESIAVRRNLTDYRRLRYYEKIVHITLRIPNVSISSWSIFRQDRNWGERKEQEHEGCVLRYATWDLQAANATQAWKSRSTPNVKSIVRYITDQDCMAVTAPCVSVDQVLVSGVPIAQLSETQSVSSYPGWGELSVSRLFTWGNVDLSWGNKGRSLQLEELVFSLAKAIQSTIHQNNLWEHELIDALEMFYGCPEPEVADFFNY